MAAAIFGYKVLDGKGGVIMLRYQAQQRKVLNSDEQVIFFSRY